MLRYVGQGDAEALLALFGDARRMRFWGHAPIADMAAARDLVDQIRAGAESGDLRQWAITLAGDDALVGTCTLAGVDEENLRAELGVAVAAAHERTGIATEAATEVIRHAFEDLGLRRLTADADPRNDAALALLEKLGFGHEGHLREHYRQGEEWQDGVLLGLLRGEWEAARRA
ncbi:MAG: GNAT family protein [Gemmatimonadota bacterium]